MSACRPKSLHRWAALVFLVSQALVVTAPIWHHHDDADDAPCAVCVAVAASHQYDLPGTPGPVLIRPDTLVAVLAPDDQADSSALVFRWALARGPPSLA